MIISNKILMILLSLLFSSHILMASTLQEDCLPKPCPLERKPIEKGAEPFKTESIKKIYAKQRFVSEKFLNGVEKRQHLPIEVHLKLLDFAKQTQRNTFLEFDLTGFSARSRIYILSYIIEFKTLSLPFFSQGPDFKELTFQTPSWKKSARQPIAECIDKYPIYLKVGTFKYKFELAATQYQKGSGRLYGLYTDSKADTYEQIYKKTIKDLSLEQSKFFSQALRDQKKDGSPISTGNPDTDKFLNGFNLLLDFEIARRLHPEDFMQQDLPLVFYIAPLLTNLKTNFPLFMLGQASIQSPLKNDRPTPSQGSFSTQPLSASSTSSLLTGTRKKRLEWVDRLIEELDFPLESLADMRKSLNYLHTSEEDSEDSYSDSELIYNEGNAEIDNEEEDITLSSPPIVPVTISVPDKSRLLTPCLTPPLSAKPATINRTSLERASSLSLPRTFEVPEEDVSLGNQEIEKFIEQMKKSHTLSSIVKIFMPTTGIQNGSRKLKRIIAAQGDKRADYIKKMNQYKRDNNWPS